MQVARAITPNRLKHLNVVTDLVFQWATKAYQLADLQLVNLIFFEFVSIFRIDFNFFVKLYSEELEKGILKKGF